MARGKKLKKSLRRYETNRKGPNQSQQEYIEKVSNPRSPEDLLLALQNPSSPAYKQMMNLIAANMDTMAVINLLVERFLVDQHEAAQREKDEIFKELLAQELSQLRHAQPLDEKSKIHDTKIPLEEEKFRERLEERAQVIDSLKTEIAYIRQDIDTLKEKSQKNNEAWETTMDRQQKEYLERLEAAGAHFVSSSGKIIDKDDPRYQDLATPASPAVLDKLVNVVAMSHSLHQAKPAEAAPAENTSTPKEDLVVEADQETSDKSIPRAPAPPPPPAPPPLPKGPVTVKDLSKLMKDQMTGMSFVFQELKAIVNARDNDTVQDFYKALENNIGNGKYRRNQKDFEERMALIENAFEILDETTSKEEDLRIKENDLKRNEVVQVAEQRAYEQKFGKLEDKKNQSLDQPVANASAKSTGQT